MSLRLIFCFLLISTIANIGCVKSQSNTEYEVIGIIDGDTIDVLDSEKNKIRIRLKGIDCPEKKQPFGQVAKNFTSNLCFRKKVKLVGNETDRNGRLIADVVLLESGVNVNYEIVKNGLAWHFVKYSDDENLERLENEARNTKLGLWYDENPIAPWDWRKGTR